jgi:hypothetical protein
MMDIIGRQNWRLGKTGYRYRYFSSRWAKKYIPLPSGRKGIGLFKKCHHVRMFDGQFSVFHIGRFLKLSPIFSVSVRGKGIPSLKIN